MKKYLPLILVGAGAVVLIGAFAFLKLFSSGQKDDIAQGSDMETVPEIVLADRPVVSLTPSSDGHWLELTIAKINIKAQTLDYELVYNLPDGRQQGVPGTAKLAGVTNVERDLLLGSESSCKYRYDEGVQTGTLTLRFRDANGKLIGKLATDFHLQSGSANLSSADGKFTYILDKTPGVNEFFVTMQTFGYPLGAPGQIAGEPYGIFKAEAHVTTCKGALAPTTKLYPGRPNLSAGSIYEYLDGSWNKVTGKSSDTGIFVGTSQ